MARHGALPLLLLLLVTALLLVQGPSFAGADVTRTVGEKLGLVDEEPETLLDKARTKVKEATDYIQGKEKPKTTGEKAKAYADDTIKDMNDRIDAAYKAAKESVSNMYASGADKSDDAAESVDKNTKSFLETIGETFDNAKQRVIDAFHSTEDSASEARDAAAAKGEKSKKSAKEGVDKLDKETSKKKKEAEKAAKETHKSAKDKARATKEQTESAYEKAKGSINEASGKASDVSDSAGQAAADAKSKVKKGAGLEEPSTLGKAKKKVNEALGREEPSNIEKGKQTLSDATDSIKEKTGQASECAGEHVKAAKGGAREKSKGAADITADAADKLKKKAKATKEEL